MIDSAILFTYTRAAPGREEKALEAFTEGMAFFGTAAHDGKCEEPINYMGTSGHSLIIVPGNYQTLAELVQTDEFLELYTKTVFAVPDIGYELGAFGQGVQDFMARWARVGTELALI
jgi:nicotinic acid phosphoribosyltransferase